MFFLLMFAQDNLLTVKNLMQQFSIQNFGVDVGISELVNFLPSIQRHKDSFTFLPLSLTYPPMGSTTMSLGRSRFSQISTVRMLPSALETSILSVPETCSRGPNYFQRAVIIRRIRDHYFLFVSYLLPKRRHGLYLHQSSTVY